MSCIYRSEYPVGWDIYNNHLLEGEFLITFCGGGYLMVSPASGVRVCSASALYRTLRLDF